MEKSHEEKPGRVLSESQGVTRGGATRPRLRSGYRLPRRKIDQAFRGISEDATAFFRTWHDVGELLEAATHEERLLILRHCVEVIELHATDPKGKSGTYALRLFPEVSPDRGFDWSEDVPQIGPGDGSPASETQNGAATHEGDDPEC